MKDNEKQIGIIIPTFNRVNNLKLVLEMLKKQSSVNFHVVIADDGSTDSTREVVEKLTDENFWKGRLKWVGCGANQGIRPARTRNIAAANLSSECSFMVMLDSDSLLEESAIEKYELLHKRHPNAVILGITEWLPPLSHDTIKAYFEDGGLTNLRKLVPDGTPKRIEGTFVGNELRNQLKADLFTGEVDNLRRLSAEWSLPLNSGYPLELFWSLGGFDERFSGYGYEDIELGIRAQKNDVECLAYSPIWSLHIWHPKDDSYLRNIENQKNLHYTLLKHGINEVLEKELDWTFWWHFHRVRGGILTLIDSVFLAINKPRTHKMKLPSVDWIRQLGFQSLNDLKQVENTELMIDVGDAKETPVDSELIF